MPRGKKAPEVPQKKPLLKARKQLKQSGRKEDYYATVVKIYRPIVERELARQGIKKSHAEFSALESELLMLSIKTVDRHFKKKLKAPLNVTVSTALSARTQVRIKQLKAKELFREQFFKGLTEAETIPAPEQVPVAKRRELQSLVDRGHQLLRSKKIKPFFTDQELRVLKQRMQGKTLQQIADSRRRPVTAEAVRSMHKRAGKKLLALAEGKKLPAVEESRKHAPLLRSPTLTEIKFNLKKRPGEPSYRQKVGIKTAEARGLNRIFKKIKYGSPPYSGAQRKLLKKFIETLNPNEQKLLKYLYGVNWSIKRVLPESAERRRELGRVFSMGRKELNGWEKEILEKLKRMVKGKPHSP